MRRALSTLMLVILFGMTGCHSGGGGGDVSDVPFDGECESGLICSEACIDPLTDREHCGATTCSDGEACASDQVCQDGHCSFGCTGQLTNCGICVDLQSDRYHCGACNNQCAPNEICYGGICGCDEGYEDCDGIAENGCEIDIYDDVNNCGKCKIQCSATNGTPICDDGFCEVECTEGFGDCDGLIDNGCETALLIDNDNCGECDLKCSGNNGTPTCASGACSIECFAGWGDCDADLLTGCETDLRASLGHCGACGFHCDDGNSSSVCDLGTCLIEECVEHYANCNGDHRDGCEVNTLTDPLNCGGCSTQGDYACDESKNEGCFEGNCECAIGFYDCDGISSNGCETATGSDFYNCGACGNECEAGEYCVNGVCGCAEGFADCDGETTGCETNIYSDVSNCGGCGVICPTAGGSPSCSSGQCGIVCQAGFANCDGNVANGCETNVYTDPNNCGVCAYSCSSQSHATGGSCSSGTCNFQCQTGWGDCESAAGCETDLNNSETHCGACNNSCGPHQSCQNGTCTCDYGFGDCDWSTSNGCETNILISRQNCGSCNAFCSFEYSCTNGVCE